MKKRAFWLVLALLVSGCATELVLEKDGALAVIPREGRTSTHLLVDVTVNGTGPFRLALDTAASISVLFDSAAQTAGVEKIPGTRVIIQGMTGSGSYPAARAERITVGEIDWSAPLLAVLPDSSPISRRMDGLLGTDFLGQYAVAYFADDRLVRLYPKERVAGPGFRGWISIPLYEMRVPRSDATLLVFSMTILGEPIPSILDLGADASLMNHRAARAMDIHVRRRASSGVTGATGPTIYTTELIFWEILAGDHIWRRRNFLVAEFPVFEALNLDKRPAAIAGIDMFRDHDIVIDFAGERLLLRKSH